MKRMTFALGFVVAVSAFGCGDDAKKAGNNDPGENNQTPISMADCQARCGVVAQKCGAPDAQVTPACSGVCSGGLTTTQILCLEGTSCDALASVFIDPDGSSVCGIGGSTGTGDCAGYPKCEGNSVVTCDASSGTVVTESSACGAMATCSSGKCEADACVETDKTGCNALNNPSGCCDDNATCFGNGNQQGETICCVPSGNACQESADCCNSDSPTAPMLCTAGTCQFGI